MAYTHIYISFVFPVFNEVSGVKNYILSLITENFLVMYQK